MKFISLSVLSILALSELSFGSAKPVAHDRRDVYAPPITYPHAGTVWTRSQHHNVTWNTSNPPVNITNKIGTIMLRKSGLTTPVILADNFSILLGRIEVQVPWVVTGNDYQLVLFGDSGNFSPLFTINES